MEWIPAVLITFKGAVLFTGMFYAIKWHHDQDRKQDDGAGGSQAPTDMRLFATMIIAVTLSIIGIVYAGCWGDVAEGGYGGAAGCAFTLFMIFMARTKAETVLAEHGGQLDALLARADPATPAEAIEQLAALKAGAVQWRGAFVARLESVEREKIYLAVAGLASMLAWKFGDVAAAWFRF